MGKKKSKNAVDVVSKKTSKFYSEFKKFISKGNIIDLAVAVVIGGAFSKIVSSLVSCIITPLTGLFLRVGDLSSLKWVITPAVEADEAAGIKAVAEVAVKYGEFLQNIVDFLVIALVIFIMLRILMNTKNNINRKEIEAQEAKKKAEEAKKKAEAEQAAAEAAEEAARQEEIRKKFIADVASQADVLSEIRDIMLRIERQK